MGRTRRRRAGSETSHTHTIFFPRFFFSFHQSLSHDSAAPPRPPSPPPVSLHAASAARSSGTLYRHCSVLFM